MRAGRLLRCDRGTVMVEFLIVFMPLFTLTLCILQLMFLYTAGLGVRHAASLGARSAVVVLPDDPARYEGTRPSVLGEGAGCRDGALSLLVRSLKRLGLAGNRRSADAPCPDGPRVAAIRRAVLMVMIPFAPKLSDVTDRHLPGPGGGDWLLGSIAYNAIATAVTFPRQPGSAALHPPGYTYGAGDRVTVRVTHVAHCGIPLARLLMCDSFRSIARGSALFDGHRTLGDLRRAHERVEGRRGLADLEVGTASRDSVYALLAAPGRFRILQAEATLPLMDAPYAYRTAEERDRGLEAGQGGSK